VQSLPQGHKRGINMPSLESRERTESTRTTESTGSTTRAYDSIVISIEWYPGERTQVPSSEDIGTLFLNLQLIYDEISDIMEVPKHFLQVERINHPNMSISLKGLGEPIKAFKDFLASLPEIIVSIWTILSRIREENAKIETNVEYLSIVRDALKVYKKAPAEYKSEHLQEFLRYTLSKSKAKITPSLPLTIKLHSPAPSSSSHSYRVTK
jgi:hypothetical protein